MSKIPQQQILVRATNRQRAQFFPIFTISEIFQALFKYFRERNLLRSFGSKAHEIIGGKLNFFCNLCCLCSVNVHFNFIEFSVLKYKNFWQD